MKESQIVKACNMRLEGASYADIIAETDLTMSQVNNWMSAGKWPKWITNHVEQSTLDLIEQVNDHRLNSSGYTTLEKDVVNG